MLVVRKLCLFGYCPTTPVSPVHEYWRRISQVFGAHRKLKLVAPRGRDRQTNFPFDGEICLSPTQSKFLDRSRNLVVDYQLSARAESLGFKHHETVSADYQFSKRSENFSRSAERFAYQDENGRQGTEAGREDSSKDCGVAGGFS